MWCLVRIKVGLSLGLGYGTRNLSKSRSNKIAVAVLALAVAGVAGNGVYPKSLRSMKRIILEALGGVWAKNREKHMGQTKRSSLDGGKLESDG